MARQELKPLLDVPFSECRFDTEMQKSALGSDTPLSNLESLVGRTGLARAYDSR